MKAIILAIIFIFTLCIPANAAWIVRWEVAVMTPTLCAQSAPQIDEFGRRSMSNAYTLAQCWTTSIRAELKTFEKLSDAEDFVQRGKDSAKDGWNTTLQNFSIKEEGK